MKKIIFSSLILVSSAFAAPEKPFISKSSGGGYVMPDYLRFEKCDVYGDRVEITRVFGAQENGVKSIETRKLELVGKIKEIIKLAGQEKISEKPNGLCDGPATVISASADGQDVGLFSTGGCGTPRKLREGPNTKKLIDLVGAFCAKSFGLEQ